MLIPSDKNQNWNWMCATNKSYFKNQFWGKEVFSILPSSAQAQLIAELAKVGDSTVLQPLFILPQYEIFFATIVLVVLTFCMSVSLVIVIQFSGISRNKIKPDFLLGPIWHISPQLGLVYTTVNVSHYNFLCLLITTNQKCLAFSPI